MFKVILPFLFLFISCNQKKETKDINIYQEGTIYKSDELQLEKEYEDFLNSERFESDMRGLRNLYRTNNKKGFSNEIILTENQKEYNDFYTTFKPVVISKNTFQTFRKKCNYENNIISYYDLIYEEKLKEFEKAGRGWTRSKKKYREKTEGSIKKITYLVEENSAYDIGLVTMWIPLKTTTVGGYISTPFIFGDLNNDQKEDCIITIHTEGNWSAANGYTNDIFVFLNKGDRYELAYVTSDRQISSAFRFTPKFIKDNYVIGTAYYLAEDEVYRNPSIKKIMKISLKKEIEN